MNKNSQDTNTVITLKICPEKYGNTRILWEKNGLFHREDGPAFINILPDGKIWVEYWTNNKMDACYYI